jgi:hypothetical protein
MSPFALAAGNRNNGALCGAFTVNLNNPLSNANSNIGARLSFLIEDGSFGTRHKNPYRLVKIR